MKSLFVIIGLFFFLCRAGAVDFIGPEEIKPGMKGYGLSVFKGWEPEQFNIEIIDVMKMGSPKGYIILAKASGAGLEKSGVIAGMSGSPVYIDGRLAGAVAYTWAFTKEPFFGITPIRQMVGEKDRAEQFTEASSMPEDAKWKRIATPFYQSGLSGEAVGFIEAALNKTGRGSFVAEAGGASKERETKPDGSESKIGPIKAGDAIAVNLAEGDINLQGIGTVTYVSNDDVFIFGHPMDMAGNNSLPVSKAYIYSVIPSESLSFKIGSSSKPIGATVYDGNSGIYCRVGKLPDMAQVELKVEAGGKTDSYRFSVADNKYYFPNIAAGALSSCLQDRAGLIDNMRLEMAFQIQMDYNGKSYEAGNRYVYSLNPNYANIFGLLGDLGQYLSVFYDGSFGIVKIKRLNVQVKMIKGVEFYLLDNFTTDKQSYYPGETILCKFSLKEYQGGYRDVEFPLKLPQDIKSGQYSIIAGNEAAFLGEVMKQFPKFYSINSMEELLRFANMNEDSELLTAGLFIPRQGLMVRDRKLDKFPENYITFFDKTTDRGNPMLFPGLVRADLPAGAAVFGLQKIGITVLNKQSQSVE